MKLQVPVFNNEQTVVVTEMEPTIDKNWGAGYTSAQMEKLEELRALFKREDAFETEEVRCLIAAGVLKLLPRSEWNEVEETDDEHLARTIGGPYIERARQAS